MGLPLPLSVILANTYLKYCESIWLSKAPSNIKPSYYKRNMDETFLLFADKHIQSFFEFSRGTTLQYQLY